MSSLLKMVLLLVFTSVACAITLSQSPSLHSPNATEQSVPQNGSLQEFSDLTRTTLYCMRVHGENMPIDSCKLALSKIERTTDQKWYFPRHRPRRDIPPNSIPMPVRYLSDDGICAIDLILAPGSGGDEASPDLIYHNAKSIIDRCVVMEGKGGVQMDFTRGDDMKIVVRRYEPSLECVPGQHPTPSYESCQEILQWIPSSTKWVYFTTDEQRHAPSPV